MKKGMFLIVMLILPSLAFSNDKVFGLYSFHEKLDTKGFTEHQDYLLSANIPAKCIVKSFVKFNQHDIDSIPSLNDVESVEITQLTIHTDNELNILAISLQKFYKRPSNAVIAKAEEFFAVIKEKYTNQPPVAENDSTTLGRVFYRFENIPKNKDNIGSIQLGVTERFELGNGKGYSNSELYLSVFAPPNEECDTIRSEAMTNMQKKYNVEKSK